MHLNQLLRIGSVALLLTLCKAASAEDAPQTQQNFWDAFTLGGYSSASVVLPRNKTATIGMNELSLILNWENESRLKFFGELEVERPVTWNQAQGLNTKQSFIDLERLYLDYNFSDRINVRAGRFLTPTGRWNQLHAAPLVWTSTRPLATSRLFPMAINGAMAFGAIALDNSALEYSVYVEALKDQKQDTDEIPFRHVSGARLAYGQSANIGLNLMAFEENTAGNPSYHMIGLDFLTHYQGIELLGEAYQRWETHHGDGGSGAYLQTAVPLPFAANWRAIVRLETLHRPNQGHDQRWLIGSTWHVKPTQLLKLEFTGGSGNQPESPRGFLASYAVLF